MIVC